MPIELGNSPEKFVEERSKCSKDFRLPIKLGNSPEKFAEERSKYTKDFRLLIELGNSLENFDQGSSKCSKDFKLTIELRNSLVNILPERAKNFRELQLQLDSRKEPSRFQLPARSRVCILGRKRMLFSSFPCKSHSRRLRVVKEEDRFIKELGLIEDIFEIGRAHV